MIRRKRVIGGVATVVPFFEPTDFSAQGSPSLWSPRPPNSAPTS